MGSFLLCPLCGKQTSLSNFDPSQFELDVMTQDVVGLGKGKGFASVGRGSILGINETTEMIKIRMLDLLELFEEHGIVSAEEIAERFDLPTRNELKVEEDETQSMKEEREDAYAKIRELIDTIEQRLDASGEYSFDDSDGLEVALTRLGDAVNALADDYSAIKEAVHSAAQDIINEIESTLESGGGFTFDESEGVTNCLEQLSNAVQRLLDEYYALKENQQ
jgi:ElaB/YqjD/DUF883 family membrane-anchored ribosome-binding protein